MSPKLKPAIAACRMCPEYPSVELGIQPGVRGETACRRPRSPAYPCERTRGQKRAFHGTGTKTDAPDFAKAYGLRVVSERQALKEALILDGWPRPDTEHIPGRRGWITNAGVSMSAFVFSKRASALMARAEALGMKRAACGDREIGLYFDPTDPAQADFAIRAIRAWRKRRVRVTPEFLARLKAAREARTVPLVA